VIDWMTVWMTQLWQSGLQS